MIQQICLSRNRVKEQPDFNMPLELLINAADYQAFEKEIRLLFDRESVERIKKAKAGLGA